MDNYDAILFDFDGVLVDSEPIHFAAWNAALAEFGLSMDWEKDYRQFVGRSDRQMLAELGQWANPPIAFDRLWTAFPRKVAEYRRLMHAQVPCPAETVRLLGELEAWPKAVVTSSSRSEVAELLELAGIGRHFAALVGAEDVARHKPDPEPYRKAAECLGARRALVVEDSDAGEQSGRAAGFDVLRVPECGRMAVLLRERLGTACNRRQLGVFR